MKVLTVICFIFLPRIMM